eukprot:jgi/Galph1/3933/GphlegSOOS_G2624.1
MTKHIRAVLEQGYSTPRFWVTLPFSARKFRRGQRCFLDNGEEIEYDCEYPATLCPGQQLETTHGEIVEVIGEEEPVSVATLRAHDLVLFGKACYVVGVYRVAVEIGRDWLRYAVDDRIDNKLRELGLEVHVEKTVFCPDRDSFLYQQLLESSNISSYTTNGPDSNYMNHSRVPNRAYETDNYQRNTYGGPYNNNVAAFQGPYSNNPPYVAQEPVYEVPVYGSQDPYVYDPNVQYYDNNPQYMPQNSHGGGGFFRRLLDELRQGKVRLAKWFEPYPQKERTKISQELTSLLTSRSSKMCNFIEWRDLKVVYKRYASLYFVAGIDLSDNELITLEVIHHYVETLDKYFGNVCELDLVFNYSKAYYILDEILLAGELEESKRSNVLRAIQTSDNMAEKNPEDPKHSSLLESGQEAQQ